MTILSHTQLTMRAALYGLVACCALVAATPSAQAQRGDDQPVRLLVPYAPGGAPDVLARALAASAAAPFGQNAIVENKPGGGGIAAAETAARSEPTGHLLFFSDVQQLAINPYLFKSLPYDPERDFLPVTLTATIPLYIAVQSSLDIHNLDDLAAHVKKHPQQLTYASSGIGSIHHIAMESLLSSLGISVTHVPYRGAGQSVPAFMGGQTALIIAAFPQLDGYVKTGKSRFIAVTTAKRSSLAPDVPSVSETIPGYDFSSEMGIVVPAGTPEDLVNRFASGVAKALQDPMALRALEGMGAVVVGSTPDEYRKNLEANRLKFQKAIQLAEIKLE